MSELLEAQDLSCYFRLAGPWGRGPVLKAVDGVSFALTPGETLGLVGESGCGKSTLGRLVLALLPPTRGRIVFAGEDLARVSRPRLKELRRQVQIIFQDPYSSLNPRMTAGQILEEPFVIHNLGRRLERRAWVEELLIADEPTTALDVTIQAQILALLARLKAELGLAVLFITHNLGIVAQTADRVAVMYAGLMVELAPTPELFRHPSHPYTVGLLNSVPRLDFSHPPGEILSAIQGHLPAEPPAGCLFRDRCPLAHERCLEEPPWVEVGPGHQVRCWNYA